MEPALFLSKEANAAIAALGFLSFTIGERGQQPQSYYLHLVTGGQFRFTQGLSKRRPKPGPSPLL